MTAARLALLLTLAACNGQKSTAPTVPVQGQVEPSSLPSGSRGDSTHATTPHDVPPYVMEIRPMLAARHTDDLPDRAALDAHEGALDALIWLNRHGETMAERVRATDLIGLYTEDKATEALVLTAQDGDAHASLVAAGVRALGSQGLDGRPEVAEVVRAHLRHDDVRVSTAAINAMAGSAETRAELPTIATDNTYPQSVRDAAAAE